MVEPATPQAMRLALSPTGNPEGLPDRVRARALAAGVRGWVRGDTPPGAEVAAHAEGEPGVLDAWLEDLSTVADVTRVPARVEGHEQFAIRGLPAGAFLVQEHQASAHHFDLRLQVGEVMRSWAVPKGPSLDPAVKRFAVEVEDHAISSGVEGASGGGRGAIVWDRGTYEQGGRVPWPQALERGHAVFVLHGEKLTGGWALQRTRPAGERPQWLLIKRRDDAARPGSDITAQRPESVVSGRTLAQLLAGG